MLLLPSDVIDQQDRQDSTAPQAWFEQYLHRGRQEENTEDQIDEKANKAMSKTITASVNCVCIYFYMAIAMCSQIHSHIHSHMHIAIYIAVCILPYI